MDRRKAMKLAAGAIVGSGAGIYALAAGFKPEYLPLEEPKRLEYSGTKTSWEYHTLDPIVTGQFAYNQYDSGSCMYATFKSIISQLADKYGEPYTSYPMHMMKYGHGGIGGFGSICGALNGAAAIIGLFVAEKAMQDSLITGLFRWYEGNNLPALIPQKATLDITIQPTLSNSILCHASNTTWVNETGYAINSNERKERCRRLTGDVATRLVVVLNEYFGNTYVTNGHSHETVATCTTCHGDSGKVANSTTKMGCTSCHTESVGHKVFADVHYSIMESK